MKLEQRLLRVEGAPSEEAKTERTLITLRIINESKSVVKAGGKWAVKDEDANPPVVQEAIFNRVPPGATDTQYVYLPSGFEWGIFKFQPEDNTGDWTNVHGGNDTEAVDLTLGD